ncbi:MAG TPA: hypothetical protein VLF88_03705 [Candidatus Babeliales bacterium]|nr:hypothetical protein [Candidatus Babeliales bacterium]
MIAATSFLMYRTGLHKRLTLFTTLISILGILCLVVLQLSLQFSSLRIAPISNSHDDNQISRDFQLLSQDIQGYALDRNQLPPTMLDAVNISNSYSSTENVKSRISKYTYKKVGTNNFQLCATFVTDTSSDNPQPGAKGVTQAYYHHIGYQCFNFNEF